MRVWKLERYDWDELDALGSASGIPEALDALSSASVTDEARTAYWRIDNCVVVQGSPRGAAVATAACVAALLPICTAASRPLLIELLEQISGGDAATPATLQNAIFSEVVKAYGTYVSLLQLGEDVERSICIDLLLYCARHDPSLRPRTQFYLERASRADFGTDEIRRYAAARLQFEQETWN